MANNLSTVAAGSEARLRELGGLGHDDSLRAHVMAQALDAFAALLAGRNPPLCSGDDLAALAKILAENAHRVAERQLFDEHRGRRAA